MAKFRKKPVVIEAEQWFPERMIEGVLTNTVQTITAMDGVQYLPGHYGFIKTLEDTDSSLHLVLPGDWIITGVKGEKYPCKNDIFVLTYEKAE